MDGGAASGQSFNDLAESCRGIFLKENRMANPTEQTLSELLQQGLALHQAGHIKDAQACYAQMLMLQTDNIDALYLDGVIAYQLGQYERALLRLEAARKHCSVAPVHTAIGNVYRDQGDFEKACASYQMALALDPAHADAHYNYGITLHEQGDLERASTAYRCALAENPAHPESWNNLGVVLKTQGMLEEAQQCYATVLSYQPNHVTALFNMGVLHADAMRFEEALSCYRRTLEVQPDYIDAIFNMGVVYRSQGALQEAAGRFERASVLRPDNHAAFQNLGAVQYELGHFDVARASYARALTLSPDHPEIRYSLGLIALAEGNYTQGWEEYEWRWLGAESSRRHRRDFLQPLWQGQDLAGKTILLHAEQGLGDTLQFVRYVPLVVQKGGRIILECQAPLARLLRSIPGADTVICRGDPLPPFDWHCPLMSLPRAFGTTLDTIPARQPYLAADALNVQDWKTRLGQKSALRVGLVWAGNPRHFSVQLSQIDRRRSVRLAQFGPLSRFKGVEWVSLQVGEAVSEMEDRSHGLNLRDFTTHLRDFEDTAALVANLDLVISIDTSVVHLAGALGIPVWLLSRYDACWRWLRERDDSPWYPCMRIFRQPSPGDWASVIDNVADMLVELSRDGEQIGISANRVEND